jgi:flagellar basal-body rod protein FlgB
MPLMDSGDIPILQMLKARLGYLSDRQRVIAENVANADTPGYTAHDLKPFSFEAQVSAATGASSGNSIAMTPAGAMAVTKPNHMTLDGSSPGRVTPAKSIKTQDSEETLDGNSVVLEDEMVKLTDARMDYDAAIGFYQKSLSLLKLAVRKPGAG